MTTVRMNLSEEIHGHSHEPKVLNANSVNNQEPGRRDGHGHVQKRLMITDFMVDHPFVIHLVLLGIGIAMGYFQLGGRSLMSHQYMGQVIPDYDEHTDIWYVKEAIFKKLISLHTEGHPQAGEDDALQMFFEQVKCDLNEDPDCDLETKPWILTPKNLQKIIEYEDKIEKHERWEHTCYVPLDEREYPDCGTAVGSVTRIIAGMLGGGDPPDYDAFTTADVKATVKMFMGFSMELSASFDDLILEGFESNNSDDMVARRYRSVFKTALPYPTDVIYPPDTADALDTNSTGNSTSNSTRRLTANEDVIVKSSKFKNFWDKPWEQRHDYHYKDWLWELYREIDDEPNGDHRDGNLRINTYAVKMWGDYFVRWILRETYGLYLIAFTITLLYATYDIGSLFLSFAALWEVLLTFPITLFIYHQVLGIEQFSPMQLTVVYILFAVGVYYYPAYVFVDHWLHTKLVVDDVSDYKTRLAIAWKQASSGAGVAQSTTFVSFLSATTGSILMFKAFGIFAAVAVGVNYILGITLYPCSIIIWERYTRQWENALADSLHNCGVGMLAFGVQEEYYKRFKTGEAMTVSFHPNLDDNDWKRKSFGNLERGVVDLGYGEMSLEHLKRQYRKLGVVIGVHWLNYLHVIGVRIIVASIALSWFGISAYGVMSIKKIEENENFMGKDMFLMKSMHGMNPYTTNDQMRDAVLMFFGTKGIVPNSRDVWSEDFGEVDYLDFQIHKAAQQEIMINFCEKLRNFTSDANGESLVVDDSHVLCMLQDFNEYEQDRSNMSFPFIYSADDDSTQRHEYLKALHHFYHESDAGIQWRNDYKMDLTVSADGEDYDLKSIEMKVMSIYEFYMPMSDAERQMESWKEFLSKWEDYCLETLGDDHGNLCHLRMTSMRMTWNEGYEGYWSSVQSSVLVSLPIIFVILCLVLNNWMMAIFCVFNVICIMSSVLGVIGFLGWRFGLVECAAVILILGFSVDFCVHISNGYMRAPIKDSRQDRVQFALLQNAHAICSSAAVSVIATLPLIFKGDNIMFQKLGILTILTIVSSLVYCFSSFTLILCTIAPQGFGGKLFCCKQCNTKGEREWSNSSQQALAV